MSIRDKLPCVGGVVPGTISFAVVAWSRGKPFEEGAS